MISLFIEFFPKWEKVALFFFFLFFYFISLFHTIPYLYFIYTLFFFLLLGSD